MESRLKLSSSMNALSKTLMLIRKVGIYSASRSILGQLINLGKESLGVYPHGPIAKNRVTLGNKLEQQLGHSTVIYGPFAGMHLSSKSTWGLADRASMILGMYESEVVSNLKTIIGSKSHFIDVGAADGYYAIGSLVADMVPEVICFEISESSREVIKECANLNKVDSRVTILGEATENFPDYLQNELDVELRKSVFLFDIEGAELQLLNYANLDKLRNATIIVEMHPVQLDPEEIFLLEQTFLSFHSVTEITTQERNPAAYIELKDWTDDERWAICSEGRYRQGRWLVLEPK